MFCAASQTVRESPSQTAVVACGSIALWFWVGVVNRRSTRCGALARAACASPLRPLMVGIPSDWLTSFARPCSAGEVDVGRQLDVVDLDEGRGVLSRLDALGDDDRDRLTVVVDLVRVEVRAPGCRRPWC